MAPEGTSPPAINWNDWLATPDIGIWGWTVPFDDTYIITGFVVVPAVCGWLAKSHKIVSTMLAILTFFLLVVAYRYWLDIQELGSAPRRAEFDPATEMVVLFAAMFALGFGIHVLMTKLRGFKLNPPSPQDGTPGRD